MGRKNNKKSKVVASSLSEETLELSLSDNSSKSKKSNSSGGWLRIVKGNKALTFVGAIAMLSLGFGLGSSGLMGQTEAQEEVPEAGLITVPVELSELNNDVVIRADIGFAESTDVQLNVPSGVPAIVTGRIPEVGQELDALDVALEITGRPVIVLPGELPAYRTLSVGMSGPDVIQFKQAMQSLGINAGDVNSDVFDETAANALKTLYERVGYTLPVDDNNNSNSITDAERGVTLAERGVRDAREAAENSRWEAANNLIAECRPDLIAQGWTWVALRDGAGWTRQTLIDECGFAAGQVDNAIAGNIPTQFTEAISDAEFMLEQARNNLTTAQRNSLPSLPMSEVLFLNNLPRRVETISVNRGDSLSGLTFRVSGATLQLKGSATEANARLLTEGGEAFFDLPGGGQQRATISAITAPTDGGSRWNIEFSPDEMTAEQFTALQGSNVRVQIPVGATQGEVLNVPVSALTAGPGGEARLEVVIGDPREGSNAQTKLVTVETGLSANGFVEVTPLNGDELNAGDLVVVGR